MDSSDADHHRCADLLASAMLIVPAPVLAEVSWLADSRGVPSGFSALLRDIARGALIVHALDTRDYQRVADLMDQYQDLDLGFVDASVIATAERLKHSTI